MVVVFVGAGEVWSGVGTLVVARAGEERRVDLHGNPKATRATTRVPTPHPHHSRPYGSSVAFSLLPPLFASVEAYWATARVAPTFC
jgi:hypothetical protein